MPFTADNPVPFELGGGLSLPERVLQNLKEALGVGQVPLDDEETISGLLLIAYARGLAAGFSFDEAAPMQAFPDYATDGVEAFEEILRVFPPANHELEDRRRVVSELWTEQLAADTPALTEVLQRIDSRFSILSPTWESATTTHHGRWLEGGSDVFDPAGPRTSSGVPNYSTHFNVTVLFDIGQGVEPIGDDARKLDRARRMLHRRLPAWVDFYIGTEQGFILDLSLLDGGMFDP